MESPLSLRRVAIAVRSLDNARQIFELAFGATFRIEEGTGVRIAVWLREDDEPILELVEPLDDDNAIARYIRKRGEGVHHLSFVVPDLAGAVASLTAGGARVVHTSSYYRTPEGEHLEEAFLHPKDAHGVLMHLAEE